MQEQNNIIARTMQLSELPNRHSHSHHQIIFGIHGHAEFEISGQRGYIQKGVGCIVPSNHIHTFYGNQLNRIFILDITKNIPLLELESAFASHALDRLFDSPKYFQFDQRLITMLVLLAEELEAMVEDDAAPSVIGQYLLHSLHHRLKGDIRVEEVGIKADRIDLSRIKRYIYGNLSEKIQTSDLARLCNISESHFYHKFRESIGMSPYQYVMSERVSAACAMLEDGTKSITEICFTLGFSSQSAFTNLFNKKMGMSPSAYRAKVEASNQKRVL